MSESVAIELKQKNVYTALEKLKLYEKKKERKEVMTTLFPTGLGDRLVAHFWNLNRLGPMLVCAGAEMAEDCIPADEFCFGSLSPGPH